MLHASASQKESLHRALSFLRERGVCLQASDIEYKTDTSLELCNDLEDLSEQEKQSELEPVTAQEIYALTRTGQFDRALELSKDFDSEK